MSVSEEIIKVLDVLAEKFGMVIDWTSQNVIPYVEKLCGKYITYEITISVIWLILGIILLFIGKWGIGKTKNFYLKYKEDWRTDWDMAAVGMGITTGLTFVVAVIIIMCQLVDIATCITFPEKIILEELKSLLSTQ